MLVFIMLGNVRLFQTLSYSKTYYKKWNFEITYYTAYLCIGSDSQAWILFYRYNEFLPECLYIHAGNKIRRILNIPPRRKELPQALWRSYEENSSFHQFCAKV